MKQTRAFGLVVGMFVSISVHAQAFGSHEYCAQLADIGADTYDTKKAGHSMNTILSVVGNMLEGNKQKRDAAQGVVAAIYGDSSIRSRKQAYSTVYSACKI